MSPGPSPRGSLLDAVARGALTADGGMGTQLHERGFPFDACYEELAVSRPEVVLGIHEAYVRAGAEVIETSTFGANAVRLGQRGLGDRVREINLAAAALARRAAGERAWVVGAVGPTGLSFDRSSGEGLDQSRVREAFRAQAAALAEGGVDAILLETLRWPVEIDLAVEGARLAFGRAVPILVQMAIGDDLTLADGTPLDAMGDRLVAMGCDVIGVNCCDGPTAVRAVEALLALPLPVSAMPHAGLPRREGDRFVYDVTPERFGDLAGRLVRLGARLVGGCCGTSPEHIERAAAAVGAARAR